MKPLPPGSTIGILGGGQLGRMTALAAARLGYRIHVFTPESGSPASQVTDHMTMAPYGDSAALERFAHSVDLVTFEFENVDVAAAQQLARFVAVRPSPDVLATCQDRVFEKTAVAAAGIGTAPWREVNDLDELRAAIEQIGTPCILKSARMGYDGKGQFKLNTPDDAERAWAAVGTRAVLEGFVDFACEVSVIAARDSMGNIEVYPIAENEHRDHILHRSIVPARVDPAVEARAREIGALLIEKLDVVGLLAVEMFVCRDNSVLVNELAPRPHNSGHWTMDAAITCQFEQLVRAITGLPLGATASLGPCEMFNLIGDEVDRRDGLAGQPGVRVHLYGKSDARPGRKMGHFTRLHWLRAR